MTAKDFILKDLESRFGVDVEIHNQHYTGEKWIEQMELYHQVKLKLFSTMEKFKELVSLCKASVEISVNDHKSYYESVEYHINEDDRKNIDKEVFEEMIKRDTVVKVQVYPHTPIRFFVVYHYDIDKAVEIAVDAVNLERV